MCSKPKFCNICMKSDADLVSAGDTDSKNVKWSCKLTFCVPEVEWDEKCIICHNCTEQLDTACSFRKLCLHANGSHIQLANGQKVPDENDEKLIEISTNKNTGNKNGCNLKSEYTCYVCNKKFGTKSSLTKHIQLHSVNRCDSCKEQFTTSTQLQLHNVQAHSETSEDLSECRFCDRAFKSPMSLNQHVRRIHRSKEASECEDSVYSTSESKTNDSIGVTTVNIGLDIERTNDLKKKHVEHCRNYSNPEFRLGDTFDDIDDRECFSSEDCNPDVTSVTAAMHQSASEYVNINPTSDYTKRKYAELELEIGIKSRAKTRSRAKFFCEECKNVFLSSKKLLNHALTAHGFDPSLIKPFACDKCDSKFSSSSNLLQHKKYHTGKRTHICTFCGKGYITKSDLNTHEKQHLNKREYQCLDCPKTFNTNKDLRSHRLVVHTDPSSWNYVCTFCQKRFPIKSNLDQHMRRHTGEKRFGCHICEKRFVDKIVLQKHIKSHSNFRAFKCEHCEREYKDNGVLEIHLTKVHGVGNAKIPVRVKKYFCHVCPKSYFAKNKLTRHMFSHTGEKPYVCHICDRKFTDKSYVKQHLKTTHNVFETDENK